MKDYLDFAIKKALSSEIEAERMINMGIEIGTDLYAKQVVKWISELNKVKSLKSHINLSPLDNSIKKLFEKHLTNSYLLGYRSVQVEVEQQEDMALKEEAVTAYTIAIRDLKSQIAFPAKQYSRVTGLLNESAFTIAGIERVGALIDIRGQIASIVENAGSFDEFRKSLPQIFDAYGITPLSNHHIENVFRTNTMAAYNLGRYESSMDNEAVTGLEYVAVLDTRTRPDHAQWDGFKAAKNAPIWNDIYPPNGYMCRCTVIPLTDFYMKDQNIRFSRVTDKRVKQAADTAPEFSKFKKDITGYNKMLKSLKKDKEKLL